MRTYRMLGLMVVCGTLVLVAGAQKKQPRVPIETPQERLGQNSAEHNKVMARRVFEELTTQARYEAIGEVFDRNCRVHFGNRTMGLSQAVAEGKGWKSAAPDLVMNVDQVSTDGDKVTVIWTARGTHTGLGNGWKPSGRRVSMRDKTVFLMKNGKIVEVWNSEYRTELFRQLGIPRTTASMFDSTEKLWAAISQMLPDPLYASLQ